MTGAPRSEAGETLLELLISLMIIGITVTALLGGIQVAAKASTMDDRQVHAQALLRSWGEHVEAATTDATYTACATVATYSGSTWGYTSPTPPAGMEAVPSGFTPTVTQVRYWNPTTGAFEATCGTDSGVQQVRLSIQVADALYPGFTATSDVVVRRPCLTLGVGGC